MSKRIKSAREILFQKMRELGTPGNWEHIVKHCGMFTFTGLKRTYCYPERNVTDLMQVVNVYRLDARLSLTCIVKPVCFIQLYQISENHTLCNFIFTDLLQVVKTTTYIKLEGRQALQLTYIMPF